MRDDRGYDDHVSMHQGTEINPLGTRLVEGMPVTIYGHANGPTFEPNRIDVAVAYTPKAAMAAMATMAAMAATVLRRRLPLLRLRLLRRGLSLGYRHRYRSRLWAGAAAVTGAAGAGVIAARTATTVDWLLRPYYGYRGGYYGGYRAATTAAIAAATTVAATAGAIGGYVGVRRRLGGTVHGSGGSGHASGGGGHGGGRPR